MIPILMYHEVRPKAERRASPRRIDESCVISEIDFARHMSYLMEHDFSVLPLGDVLADDGPMRGPIPPKRPVAITFDDGHIGNYRHAFPILTQHGFCAVFFITTNWVGKTDMVSWDQLREMVAAGMTVGSHTATHSPLSTTSDFELREELLESKREIERQLNVSVDFLSVPHGDCDARVPFVARELGYKCVLTSQPEYFETGDSNPVVGRLEIKAARFGHFISIVEQQGIRLSLSRHARRIKFRLRSCIGVNNYRKAYRVLNRIHRRESG